MGFGGRLAGRRSGTAMNLAAQLPNLSLKDHP
jgi:hypothetical protein